LIQDSVTTKVILPSSCAREQAKLFDVQVLIKPGQQSSWGVMH
jgi:hypothetical protein